MKTLVPVKPHTEAGDKLAGITAKFHGSLALRSPGIRSQIGMKPVRRCWITTKYIYIYIYIHIHIYIWCLFLIFIPGHFPDFTLYGRWEELIYGKRVVGG